MKFNEITPPRSFRVGANGEIEIVHVADMYLADDEQVTLKTESGTEYDIARKDFGYYATPSMNNRLVAYNLKTALVRGRRSGRAYVLMVETGKEHLMQEYCDMDDLRIVCWLNDDADLDQIEATFPDRVYTREQGISKQTIHEPSQSLTWLHRAVQADWLSSLLAARKALPDAASFLMTDCGDGALLKAIAADHPEWKFRGSSPREYETAGLHAASLSIEGVNEQFFNVDGQHDIVLSLDSLPRARETTPVLDKLVSLLGPGGVLMALAFVNPGDVDLYTETRAPAERWKTGFNSVSRSAVQSYFSDRAMHVEFQPIPMSEELVQMARSQESLRVVFDEENRPLIVTTSGLIIQLELIVASAS